MVLILLHRFCQLERSGYYVALELEDDVGGTRRHFGDQNDVTRAKRPDTLVRRFCEGVDRELFGPRV